jgi:predicted acyltransferase
VDPEGLLGTIPAIAHTLLGFYACKLMMESKDTAEKVLRFLLFGAVMVFIAYLFTYLLPLNKRIWSPTYVLMTCGLCSMLQGILMYVIDIKGSKGWITPFLVFGVNPLFLYVFSELLAIIFGYTGIGSLLYDGIHALIANTYNASLAYAITFTLICLLVGYPLYKRNIYIKI